MTAYVALLRAVNVGGTGKLAMSDLKALCEAAGFRKVKTYIASGNVVFETALPESKVKAMLQKRLEAHAGQPVGVLVRSATEMAAIIAANPFPDRASSRTAAIFLDAQPPKNAADAATGRVNEEIAFGKREIYIHYPDGMGRSKLKIPAAKNGTARNMNTVAKLAEMSAKL